MNSKELSPSTESDPTSSSSDRLQPTSTQTSPPPIQKRTKVEPVPGDLTSRLVNVTLFFCFGTAIGLVAQMAVTRRAPNLGAGMAIGTTAAVVCAFKDLEGLRISPALLSDTRRFSKRFEDNLDEHGERLADDIDSKERLESKVDRLSERIDTVTLSMTRLPAPDSSNSGRLLNKGDESASVNPPNEPAHSRVPGDSHLNGNGRSPNSLGTGF